DAFWKKGDLLAVFAFNIAHFEHLAITYIIPYMPIFRGVFTQSAVPLSNCTKGSKEDINNSISIPYDNFYFYYLITPKEIAKYDESRKILRGILY
ncbi:MAG: hypothetical protein ACOY46_09275, partial [Bacillota bacterium]